MEKPKVTFFIFSVQLSWVGLTLQTSKVRLRRLYYALPWGVYGRFIVEVSNLLLRAKRRNQKSFFVAYSYMHSVYCTVYVSYKRCNGKTSTEVLRRSPQWAFNTHTHRVRERQVNQQTLVEQLRSSNYNKFEFNWFRCIGAVL